MLLLLLCVLRVPFVVPAVAGVGLVGDMGIFSCCECSSSATVSRPVTRQQPMCLGLHIITTTTILQCDTGIFSCCECRSATVSRPVGKTATNVLSTTHTIIQCRHFIPALNAWAAGHITQPHT